MDNDGRMTATGRPAGRVPVSRPGLAGLLQIAAPGCRIDGVSVLAGGTSAKTWRVRLRNTQGARSSVIVRLPGERALLADPDLLRREAAALTALRAAGVPVPRVLAMDLTGRLLGQPAVVLEFLCGTPGTTVGNAEGAARQLARCLASIHAAPVAAVPGLRWPGWLNGSPSPAAPSPGVLLHGDFWPGNTIWREDQLVGVIDWEDVAAGDPLVDVANARLEVTWFWGGAAAEAFTAEYISCTRRDTAKLAAWDISIALLKASQIDQWGLTPAELTRMRAELAAFVERAYAAAAAPAVRDPLG